MRLAPLIAIAAATLACRGGEIALDLSSPGGLADFCDSVTPEPLTLRVDFPASPPGCRWGQSGNLEMQQAVVTARSERFIELELPDGVVICDMSLNFQVDPQVVPTMEYDDNMFFLYNRVVLAASYAPMVDRFSRVRDLPIFDWMELRGMEFGFDPSTPTYCLGEAEGRSRCDIPPPETSGPLVMDFDDDLIDELSFRAIELNAAEFGFVVIGDNDPQVDCSHDAFSFDVTVGVATP